MTRCDRCGNDTIVITASFFNTDTLCMECRDLEEKHPAWQAAHDEEVKHVLAKDYNFKGVGLPKGYHEWAKTQKAGARKE